MDDKDIEIARLQGKIEGMKAAETGRINPGRILAWLILGGLLILIGVLAVGTLAPKETDQQRAERIATGINAACDLKWTKTEAAAAECRRQELARRMDEGLQ